MELKQFQRDALKQVDNYLQKLAVWKKKADENPDLEVDFPKQAWRKTERLGEYHGKVDGLNRPLPNFCLKVPTGGGKTFLAVKIIDLVNLHYRRSKTGLVLWVVPTRQIYQQTLKALRDKDHPYRQHLDLITGGRTQIIEKTDHFSPSDVLETLVVLLLMLPSANRKNKETLKLFQDSGGFDQFFPLEDATVEHEALLEKIPNLDHFGSKDDILKRRVKTSMGNTLRLLNPLVILDEGHKAYGKLAQATIAAFNPCIVLELSATPKAAANKLVTVSGRDLEREDMLKLDLHITNEINWDWRDTLRHGIEKRKGLEETARDYEAESGRYIRPILLIQVERTGRDTRDDNRHTHTEQIKQHLIEVHGIRPEEIAIKSSNKDDLEDVDDDDGLLSRQCQIRFIITKYALQEGWDCPFAYVLAILTNAGAKTSLTQLVGRILRQPNARKTGVLALDESYVYAYQQQPTAMLEQIKEGFEKEGLGDFVGRLAIDGASEEGMPKMITSTVRDKFKKAVSVSFLPLFARREGKDRWRPVSYAMDIEAHINWQEVDLAKLLDMPLSKYKPAGVIYAVGLGRGGDSVIWPHDVRRIVSNVNALDPFYLARVLSDDLIPNPWIANSVTERILDGLQAKHGVNMVAGSFIYIVEQARQHIQAEKDRLAKLVFDNGLENGDIRFTIIADEKARARLFSPRQVKDTRRLTDKCGQPLQLSLFDIELEDTYNDFERDVAWFLEEQTQLYFWWRNISRTGYSLQGWQKNRIFPDFVFSTDYDGNDNFKIFIVETKGIHLKNNDDTKYKEDVFSMADQLSKTMQIDSTTFMQAVKQHPIKSTVVHSDQWKKEFTRMIEDMA
ncbi:MAG: DEAD/DEAH box helicase family protein [Nitrospirae bacterium]|nr:DEAD/DEAH box helicase family protein [Nitrospirota bacterium]